ncbi:MAG: hypothetical protein IT359_09550 [Gemmatimonadaceae bacterium]|nr:hypothetical protein [Gemmatimonadaceae bacterium]
MSSSERDDVVQRVARKLTRGSVRPEVIAEAVDRTLGALAARMGHASHPSPATSSWGEAPPDGASGVAMVAAVGVPDLASRLRAALEGAGHSVGAMAAATEGRHTVVALPWPSTDAAQLRAVAETLGARFSWRGDVR